MRPELVARAQDGACCLMQGSGLSEGEWVTLGAHEVDGLEAAVAQPFAIFCRVLG